MSSNLIGKAVSAAGIGIRKSGLKIGKVWSNRMDKTITVVVPVLLWSSKYQAYVKKSTKLKTHDEHEICDIGDTVEIRHCRKRSKTKAHELVRILKKVPGLEYKMNTYTHPTNIPPPPLVAEEDVDEEAEEQQ